MSNYTYQNAQNTVMFTSPSFSPLSLPPSPLPPPACHVFECRDSSQYVLTTIGQAFELRYKLYLKKPRPNVHPVEVNES